LAEITITASAVAPIANSTIQAEYNAGATIAAGQFVYIDTANSNVLKLAQGDGTTLESTVAGMALSSGSTGQPIKIAIGGTVTIGAVVAAGVFYFLSSTAGNMELFTDVASTEKTVLVGFATTTSILDLRIIITGIAKT